MYTIYSFRLDYKEMGNNMKHTQWKRKELKIVERKPQGKN
jgi:hypothetical protein